MTQPTDLVNPEDELRDLRARAVDGFVDGKPCFECTREEFQFIVAMNGLSRSLEPPPVPAMFMGQFVKVVG